MTNQTTYVDGYVLVVPKDNIEEYKKLANESAQMWVACGALSYRECMAEDLEPDLEGCKHIPFDKLKQAKEDETVWFSYIEYKSREHRDEVNAKVMEKMKEKYGDVDPSEGMPFDMTRMSFGGFSVEVSA